MALISVSNNALSDITALPAGLPTGALTLLSTQTASSSASIEFTSGIDSTYDSYVFKFIDIHPQTSNADLMMNFSTDGGSNYNVTKTTTHFRALHNEADTATSLAYDASNDLAQSTSDVSVLINIGATDSDMSGSGYVQLFNPSSSIFVKHFIANANRYDPAIYTVNQYTAGYGNTTSPINAVIFRMDSGNIDDGIIKMYGVS
jgi:hypothetical protein